MRAIRTDDLGAFLDLAGSLLRRDEARNHLILTAAAMALADRRASQEYDAWAMLDPGPVAAALSLPSRQLLLAEPTGEEVIEPLARAIAEDQPGSPGVTGTRPSLEAFVEAWTQATGRSGRVVSELTLHALDRVPSVERASGTMRPATRSDRDLVVAWLRSFATEAPLPDEIVANELERFLEGRLEEANAGYRLWVDASRPVSLAGFIGPKDVGFRVGPVYTPVEHRGSGYARTLLADLVTELLGREQGACYLASDVGNTAATALYASVGFRRVADAAMVAFEEAVGAA